MFEHPLFLPIALFVIVAGLFYLVVTSRKDSSKPEQEGENQTERWQVQCPSCKRWKKMQPVRRAELLDEVAAPDRVVLPGTHHRFLHEYKCKFCGHTWHEHYST